MQNYPASRTWQFQSVGNTQDGYSYAYSNPFHESSKQIRSWWMTKVKIFLEDSTTRIFLAFLIWICSNCSWKLSVKRTKLSVFWFYLKYFSKLSSKVQGCSGKSYVTTHRQSRHYTQNVQYQIWQWMHFPMSLESFAAAQTVIHLNYM